MNKCLLMILSAMLLIGMFSTLTAENNDLFPWVRMGLGAKAMAMGGTGTAYIDNITATYWNPAGLANVKRAEFAMMYTDMGMDRMQNFVALGTGFKFGYVALSWINASVKDIEKYDNTGSYQGDFNYNDNSVALSLGLGPGKLKFGLTAKMYMSKLDDEDVNGFGSDLGLLWDINDYISLGATARDIYSELDDIEVPGQYTLGMAVYPIYGLTFATDLKKEKHDDDVSVHIGAEYWTGVGKDTEIGSSHSGINLEEKTRWDEIFSSTEGGIRLGMNEDKFSAGLGLRFKMFEINYAFVQEPADGFDDSHQLTLILKF